MRERNFYNYKYSIGANGVAEEEGSGKRYSHKGYSYKTAASLVENVIAKKELSLFSEDEAGGPVATTTASRSYVDRTGKNVSLTPIQLKLVTAFAQVIDTIHEKEEIKEYIRQLPFRIEDRQRGEDGRSIRLPNSIRSVIDIPELTKCVYSSERIGGKQADKVRDEIRKLSELTQVFKFKDERGGTLTIEAPLITLGKRVKYETKEGVVKLNKVEIYFEDVFVYDINNRYSLSPTTLLQLWNATGVQTELFTMLLFLLQSVRGNFIAHANRIAADREKELRKAKKDKAEIEREVEALRRSSLTYKESVTSILERLGTDKYKDKGKYLRLNVINRDLKQATDALKKMGIISDFYESSGSTGDRVCNFVINDKWLADEAERIKALTPPGADGKDE